MTDKELLENAAKAMGFIEPHSYREKTQSLLWLSGSGFPVTWSPLTDDGTALRMAVRLQLSADFFEDTICVAYSSPDERFVGVKQLYEPVGTDPCAAARRAIVRIAAEVGKDMEYAERAK